jgi:hypothetical protein
MRLPSLLALPLSLFLATSAYAQPASPRQTAAAQTLYEEATADLDAKRYASACRKLEDVTSVVPDALGAKLTLGGCYEELGKLASAWAQYALVETMALKMGQPERAKKAAEKVAALRPLLATLHLQLTPTVTSIPGIVLRCDGTAVDKAHWGTPLPVDAGEHVVVTTAPGRITWKRRVKVPADGAVVSVTILSLEREAVVEDDPAPEPISEPADRPAPAASTRAWQRPAGLTVMGLGAAGVGVGVVIGLVAMMQHQGGNNPRQVIANAAIDTTIAGGAVLVGGIVLFATAPSAGESPKRTGRARGVQAQLELIPGGLGVRGTW